MNSTFTYFNPNPTVKIDKRTGKYKRWKKGDCVIRAFCAALNLPWSTVFDEMCKLAAQNFDMPNSDAIIEKYAKLKGFTKCSLPEYTTVKRFSTYFNGIYIVRIRGHVACIKNNKVHDCWDCGGYKMKTYYKLEQVPF